MVVAVIMLLAITSDSFCFLQAFRLGTLVRLKNNTRITTHVIRMPQQHSCVNQSISLFQSPFQETSPPVLSLANPYTVLHLFHPHEGELTGNELNDLSIIVFGPVKKVCPFRGTFIP